MKPIVFKAVLAAFVAVAALATAQSKAQSADSGAMSPATLHDPIKPATVVRHRISSTADARGCLRFMTNTEIIRCTEKYL